MVNGNTNGGCELYCNLCFAKFFQCKTFTKPQLHVVSLGWRMDNRPEQTSSGTWTQFGSPCTSCDCAALLATCLIKPCPHVPSIKFTSLTTINFTEVDIWNDIVATMP